MHDKPSTARGYTPDHVARVKATCLYLAAKLGDLAADMVVVGGRLCPSTPRRLRRMSTRPRSTMNPARRRDRMDVAGRASQHVADGFAGLQARAARLPFVSLLLLVLVSLLHGTPLAADAFQPGDGHRWRALGAVAGHGPGFTRVPSASVGIAFTNALSDERSITNRNLLSGAGVALGDFDGDGWCDVFLCGLDSDNRLFRNLGNWRFTDVTPSGSNPDLACVGDDSTGAAFADVDGDDDLDLLVNGLGSGTRLFVNDGKGHFAEATDAAGLRSRSGATSLALADVDGDGDLDLYVANFRPTTILDRPTARFSVQTVDGRPRVAAVDGRPVTEPDLRDRFLVDASGQVQETGEADVLWLNDGQGRFQAASWTDGTFLDESGKALASPPRDWGLAARFHDIDHDGDPDLYVCNDLWTPDRLWINESAHGKARFRAASTRALRCNPTFSMGADFGDLDRDGHEDFLVVDMLSRDRFRRQTQLAAMAPEPRPPGLFEDRVQLKRNALQMGRGDGTFAEVARQAGLEATEWSWGPIFLDVDLDGFEDVLVGTGQHRDFQDSDGAERIQAAQRGGRALRQREIDDLVRSLPRLVTPKLLFRNRRDATFEEVGARWGFGDASIAQGMATADLDNDGDVDVVVNELFAAPGLYRNEGGAPRLRVQLKGPTGNRHGLGARITVWPPNGASLPVQQSQVMGGGRYLSGEAPSRTFAAARGVHRVRVDWPDGRRSEVTTPEGRWLEVDHAGAMKAPPSEAPGAPWFEDVSSRLAHGHVEEPFDDFQRQPLLPNRLSLLGPGVTWADLNGDGREDLLVGTGKGGVVGVFAGQPGGTFRRLDAAPFNKPVGRDLTTLLPMMGVVFAGSANYEDGMTNGGAIRVMDPARGVSGETVLNPGFSTGPLAAADLNGDGALEVFVGGRVVAGRYPEPAASLVLGTAGGRMAPRQRLEGLGLVTAACFTDLDGDGDADLVASREWECPAFLRNEGGTLRPWSPVVRHGTNTLKDADWSGWWNGVTAGDLDGDGRLDLVLGNWGRNTPFHASADAPRRLHYGDLGAGAVETIESWVEPGTGREWPQRELPMFRMVLPPWAERFPTHAAFAAGDLVALMGDPAPRLQRREVRWLDSALLMNRGDFMELVPLPASAQRSPVFGVVVADMDGDGDEDVFLSQNWAAAQPMVQRTDAGRGLWLRNDGRGVLAPDEATGVAVHGDGRGAAAADFDGDGRVDLAVAQNAAGTTLWRNVRARPGLRVRLKGQGGNPVGFGAVARLVHEGGLGPAREWHGGAGWWSVDGPVAVLGNPWKAHAIEVRWPGKQPRRQAVPPGAVEVEVVE